MTPGNCFREYEKNANWGKMFKKNKSSIDINKRSLNVTNSKLNFDNKVDRT